VRYDHDWRGEGRGWPRGYDAVFRAGGYGADYRARGYDADYRARGYDAGYRGEPRRPPPPPVSDASGWAPYAFTPFGWDPALGWAGWGMGMGYVPWDAARRAGPERVPPRQSPTWGRGGDGAVRGWAARHGYDVEFTFRPRRGPRG